MLVVSEESSTISVAVEGHLSRSVSTAQIRSLLAGSATLRTVTVEMETVRRAALADEQAGFGARP